MKKRKREKNEVKKCILHQKRFFFLYKLGVLKLILDLTGIQKVDRLEIIVTFLGKEQLLGIPHIPKSSEEQAMAVQQAVDKWV